MSLESSLKTIAEELKGIRELLAGNVASPQPSSGAQPVPASPDAPAPSTAPAPSADESPATITRDEVGKAAVELAKAKGRPAAAEVLNKFSVTKVSELKPEQYAAALNAFTEAVGAE
jgi:hypothetical protein